MTHQEIFETVARHLLKQGRRSVRDGENPDDLWSSCAYRGPDGTMCAAGVLITDEEYNEAMEDHSFSGVCMGTPALAKRFAEAEQNLIDELQALHDNNLPYEWKKRLYALGKRYNLDISFLN